MKTDFRYLLGFILTLFVSGCAYPEKNIAGFWPLNEGYGDTVYDCSEYEINGKICGAHWVRGKNGWALEFNKQGDFVSIPAGKKLQFGDDFTLSCWIYPFSVNEGSLVDMSSRYSGYALILTGGKIGLKLRTELNPIPSGIHAYSPIASGHYAFSSEESVAANAWAYVVCTYSAEKDEINFYCNGEKVKNSDLVAPLGNAPPPPVPMKTRGRVTYAPYLPMTHMTIGSSANWPGMYGQYRGFIRDVKVCDAVLTAAEIKDEYSKKFPVMSNMKLTSSRDMILRGLTSLIKGRIIDADTGEEMAGIVSVKVDNKYYVTDENICWGNSGSVEPAGFVSSAKFTVKVPPGKAEILVTRGLEFLPFDEHFETGDNAEKDILVKLKRLVDMPSLGWYAGAHHEHSWGHGKGINYDKFMTEDGWRYFADAKKADGFNYISSPRPYPNGDFKAAWEDNKFILWPTTEDQICHIFSDGVAGERDTTTRMENLLKKGAHGLVQPYGADDLQPGQVAIAMALGKIDAWQADEKDWFRYLNLGFKCAVGQGSDYYYTYPFARNMTREYSRMVKLSWEDMVRAYKNHATFLTSGPLVIFSINNREPGETVILNGADEEKINISVSAWDILGLEKIELIRNGKLEKTFSCADTNPKQTNEKLALGVSQSGWLIVKAYGKKGYAVTSPIYIQFGKKPLGNGKEDIDHFIKQIEDYRKYLSGKPLGHNPEREIADAEKAIEIYRSLIVKPRTWPDEGASN